MRIDTCLHLAVFSLLFGALGGCSWLQSLEQNRRIEAAIQDDAACRERGYEYPGGAYRECRLQLHDARLREQHMELQMSRQYDRSTDPGSLPQQQATDPYRPLRLEDYACELRRDEEGQPWIHCSESARAR